MTGEVDYTSVVSELPNKLLRLWKIKEKPEVYLYRLGGELRLAPDEPGNSTVDSGTCFKVPVEDGRYIIIPPVLHGALGITPDTFFEYGKITSDEAVIKTREPPATGERAKKKIGAGKKKKEREKAPALRSYIKTRIILAKPAKTAKHGYLPPAYQQVVERALEKCTSDTGYCFKWLASDKSNNYYLGLFTGLDLELPSVTPIDPVHFTEARLQVHDFAMETVFKQVYPGEYLELVKRLQAVFDQLSAINRNAFKFTGNEAIKRLVINCNDPVLEVLTTVKGKASLWQEFTSFDFNGQEVMFVTRAFWTAIQNLYFAYRNRIIRDQSLQLLAGYLSDPALVTDRELEEFFREDDPPRGLARKCYKQLVTGGGTEDDTGDLFKEFPGWKGIKPSWQFFLDELRQVRNAACTALDDDLLYRAFQRFLEQDTVDHLKELVITGFEEARDGNRYMKDRPLEEYLVFLLVFKLKHPLRKLFLKTWECIKSGTGEHQLTGLPRFIHDYTVHHFTSKNNEDYRTLPATQAWSEVRKGLAQRLEETRGAFRAAFPDGLDGPREWLERLAGKGIASFIGSAHRLKTGTGDGQQPVVEVIIPCKQKVFRAFHRATPLQSFVLPVTGTIVPSSLLPCLENFILTRFERQAETLLRPLLVKEVLPELRKGLATPALFVNQQPVFKNPGFSLNLADHQMFKLDLDTGTLQLAFIKDPTNKSRALWFTFSLQGLGSKRMQPFLATDFGTDGNTLVKQWKPGNPVITSKSGRLLVHVPFEKVALPAVQGITLDDPTTELVAGIDVNLDDYAVVSVMEVTSCYRKVPITYNENVQNSKDSKDHENSGEIRYRIDREIVRQKELAHYYISDIEALDVKFDPFIVPHGNFKNLRKGPDDQEVRHRRNGNRKKRPGRNTRGKGKLRWLLEQVRELDAEINRIKRNYPATSDQRDDFQQASRERSELWQYYSAVLDTISSAVAAKIRDIVLYFKVLYPALTIRVQVEDLRWTKHAKRSEAGYYLAHNQKLFFHSQIQKKTAHLLREHGVGVWRVDPRNSSQTCNYCGHHVKGQRQGKTFTCRSTTHRTPTGSVYTCNADLNAARNIALFRPLDEYPLIP
ncbi:MAG: zinc ribbon domain-containing protein [Candidatus Odinarchaeota archaeon]